MHLVTYELYLCQEDLCQELVDLSTQSRPQSLIVVLGDDRGISPETESELEAMVTARSGTLRKISLGGDVLFASHCIVLLQHYLDKHVHQCSKADPRQYKSAKAAGRYSR